MTLSIISKNETTLEIEWKSRFPCFSFKRSNRLGVMKSGQEMSELLK